MDRWQVVKDGVPVALCDTIEDAEREYVKYGADEIRRVESDKEK